MPAKYYDEESDLSDVFVGRRIVAAEMPITSTPCVENPYGYGTFAAYGTDPVGLLTLDDGTKVYVVGNDGGCACSSGCYELTKLASVENIITSVKTIANPAGDEYGRWDEDNPGRYSIFVITAAEELNVAEFEGTDGNGYYGTGFHLAVVPVEASA